jgi:hypothetical protein
LRKSSTVWIWQHDKRTDDYKIILNCGVRVKQRLVFPLISTDFPCGFPLPPRASRRGGGGDQAAETESMLTLAESGAVELP